MNDSLPKFLSALPQDVERALALYQRDPLYRFTEGEARHLADEVLRLRDALDRSRRYRESMEGLPRPAGT